MNKIVMFIWAIVVGLIFGVILLLGFNNKENTNNLLDADLKNATKIYITDKNIVPKLSESVIVFVEDLVNGQYIDSEELNNSCVESVVYTNGLFKDDYEINVNCKDKE